MDVLRILWRIVCDSEEMMDEFKANLQQDSCEQFFPIFPIESILKLEYVLNNGYHMSRQEISQGITHAITFGGSVDQDELIALILAIYVEDKTDQDFIEIILDSCSAEPFKKGIEEYFQDKWVDRILRKETFEGEIVSLLECISS
jgi:predicted nucleic-acid-binding protein